MYEGKEIYLPMVYIFCLYQTVTPAHTRGLGYHVLQKNSERTKTSLYITKGFFPNKKPQF